MRKILFLGIMIMAVCSGSAYAADETDSIVSIDSDSAMLGDSDSTILVTSDSALAEEPSGTIPARGGRIDWFQLIIEIGYIAGVFVVFPLIVITNICERLSVPSPEKRGIIQSASVLDEDERNFRASLILRKIEEKLTLTKGKDGNEWLTITKGSQARFLKHGLDYINKVLVPTDIELVKRTIEFNEVYIDRVKRLFTGSGWIITCSVLVGGIFYLSGGISSFLILHLVALLSYIMASRPTSYAFLKRMERMGGHRGLISAIMSSLFMGSAEKHYVSVNGGTWKRDHESEFTSGIIGLLITFVVAMLLGFFTGFIAIINFLLNYSNSIMLPFNSGESWFEKKIQE